MNMTPQKSKRRPAEPLEEELHSSDFADSPDADDSIVQAVHHTVIRPENEKAWCYVLPRKWDALSDQEKSQKSHAAAIEGDQGTSSATSCERCAKSNLVCRVYEPSRQILGDHCSRCRWENQQCSLERPKSAPVTPVKQWAPPTTKPAHHRPTKRAKLQDASERLSVEDRLRQLEERFDFFLEHIHERSLTGGVAQEGLGTPKNDSSL